MTTKVPRTALWREPGFRQLWAGEGLSQLGAQFAGLAMPIVAVNVLHATDVEMGYLNAAQTSAFLVFGLLVGAWVDRMRKRTVMVVADLVRVLAVACIPLFFLLGQLEMWHLFAIGAVISVAAVFFDVSYQSYVPVLVRDELVGSANSALEATAQTMRMAGPAAAGLLLKVVSAPLLLVANALGFLASAVALLLIRDNELVRPKHERQNLFVEIREGLTFVARTSLLMRIVATTGITNLGSVVAFTLSPILILRVLGMDATLYGVLLAIGAIGGLAGSVFANRIASWIGEGPAITVASVTSCLVAALMPLAVLVPHAVAIAMLVVFEVTMSSSVVVYNVVQVTARQRIAPKRLLGRMNASIRFVVWGVMPVGALLAGWLGAIIGTVSAMWVGVGIGLLGLLPWLLSPFAWQRELPRRTASELVVT